MSASAPARPARFTFDTVFDGEAVIPSARPRRAFSAEDLEAARREGFAAGERSATAEAERDAARALESVAAAARAAFQALDALMHEHRSVSVELARRAAGVIAGAALEAYPEAPVAGALEALGRELAATTRLRLSVAARDPERLEGELKRALAAHGFEGRLSLVPAAPGAPGAFVIDWGEGRAAFDPAAVEARVAAALQEGLEAERLGRPLRLDPPAEPGAQPG